MISVAIWTLLFLTGAGLFAYQIWGRLGILLRVRTDDGRDYSKPSWSKRVQNTLVYAFGQKKFFLRDKGAGIMHIVIFWGFTTLSLQVVTMFVRGWFPDFHIPGLSADLLGGPYALLRDIFQAGVIIAVSIALARWAILRPERLYGFLPAEAKLRGQSHAEAYLILCFILTIMISGFFYDAGRIASMAHLPEVLAEARWQPISCAFTLFFEGSPDRAAQAANIAWWVHNLVILVFLNLLPLSKHFHILTSIPNVFFGKIEPKGKLTKKDYTVDEPLFGRSTATQFTWKQTLDMFSCTECGRCSSVCPATATGKPLAPRQMLLNLRDRFYSDQKQILKFPLNGQKAAAELPTLDLLVGEDKAVIDEVVWSCVTCRACEEACPVNIEYVDKIIDMRQHLTQEASRFPEELARTFKGLETQSNPWGISASERISWADGLDVPKLADNPNAEWLYYVGCGGSFDSNHRKATVSFTKILKNAGVSFAVLGNEELCNGETARRLGNEYLYQTMAEALTGVINGYKVKKILVNCPHCFNTMKHEYKDFNGHWHVESAGEFVNKLVADGKITLTEEFKKRVAYHDSCYYGRHNDIFEEPRNLLKGVKGVDLAELPTNKRNATCCGAGGGRMWVEEKKDQRVNIMRTEEALGTKPDVIATSCPYCRIMVGSGVNEKGVADKVAVMDVMEIVAQNMQPNSAPQ